MTDNAALYVPLSVIQTTPKHFIFWHTSGIGVPLVCH